jgi:hypothetical protein
MAAIFGALASVLAAHPNLAYAATWIAIAGFAASWLDAVIPQPAAGSHWLPVRKVLSALAGNVGNAANKNQPPLATWILRVLILAAKSVPAGSITGEAAQVVQAIAAAAPLPPAPATPKT